jgi:hypothetical protein
METGWTSRHGSGDFDFIAFRTLGIYRMRHSSKGAYEAPLSYCTNVAFLRRRGVV